MNTQALGHGEGPDLRPWGLSSAGLPAASMKHGSDRGRFLGPVGKSQSAPFFVWLES